MIKQKNTKKRKTSAGKHLPAFLILAVALVLVTLILAGDQTQTVALSVTVVLTVLILAITGSPELLPRTLKAILAGIGRIVRP
jgi:hypothetical protein